tara:strand:- start:61 stop:483 length:423 start_codon:yes stop_codon:yes gene_type:complete
MRSILILGMLTLTNCFVPTLKKNTVPSEKFIRDSEKKHGRIALLALPTLSTIASVTGENSVTWLSNQPMETQLIFFSVVGALETVYLTRFKDKFDLKDEVIPGNFPPLPVPKSNVDFIEDTLGRLAMLSVFIYMVENLVK